MINVTERENPVDMVKFSETDRLFLNPVETDDWRIRRVIRDKVIACSQALPEGLCLMVFEAFRSRQWDLWKPVIASIQQNNLDWNEAQVRTESSRWVSPTNGFGSGHQAGAAVDVKLACANRSELDFGGPMKGHSGIAPTQSPVQDELCRNRDLLVATMQAEGMINYPDEWWHFSYGDRLWAEVTKRDQAFFAPVE